MAQMEAAVEVTPKTDGSRDAENERDVWILCMYPVLAIMYGDYVSVVE